MGRLGFSAAIAAIVVSVGYAYGQVSPQPGQVMSRQQLEQLQKESDQRLRAAPLNLSHSGPIAPMPNPKVYPIKGFWVCKDLKSFEPIYAKPNVHSRIVARSMWFEAVGGAYTHGFARVLVNKNLIGYIPLKYVSPFHDPYAPSVTCQVMGVQANGIPAMNLH
ncbi:hypothetical protein [Acidiphilium sp.]|uniref:hypothetical protein n=1 Tax=Acidiphilium sp. TaxID=527 RepID=UPI003D08D697